MGQYFKRHIDTYLKDWKDSANRKPLSCSFTRRNGIPITFLLSSGGYAGSCKNMGANG